MRKKLLAYLLVAAGSVYTCFADTNPSIHSTTSTTSTTSNRSIETLIEKNKIKTERQKYSKQYPFLLEKQTNYDLRGNHSSRWLRSILKARGKMSFKTETIDLPVNKYLLKLTLEGEVRGETITQESHTLLDLNKDTKTPFITLKYLFKKTKDNKVLKEDRTENTSLEQMLVDEVSIIQFVRTLDFNDKKEYEFDAIGISDIKEGKHYPIKIKHLGDAKVNSLKDKFQLLDNIEIWQGKSPPKIMNIFYSKDSSRTPAYIRYTLGSIIIRSYYIETEFNEYK